MLDIFLAHDEEEIEANKLKPRISLGGAIYWFLHRYFVHADLTPGSYSFLNLYEDTEISGYQLQRLKMELEEAQLDLSARETTFKILIGWNGSEKIYTAEDWREVNTQEAKEITNQLLSLINEAQTKNLVLLAFGD